MKKLITFFALLAGFSAYGQSVWGDAEWIGGGDDDRVLYAPYFTAYTLDYELEIKGDKASVLYGIGDERLMRPYRNIYHLASEADSIYYKVEIDQSDLPVKVNIYRSGISDSDNASRPVATFDLPRKDDSYHVILNSCFGSTWLKVNDTILTENLGLNPVGKGGDYLAFPILGELALQAADRGEAVLKSMQVKDFRQPRNTIWKIDADIVSSNGRMIKMHPEGSGCPMLRHQWQMGDKNIREAVLRITARGIYDVTLNGHRLTENSRLNPGFTQYDVTHLYQNYDVAALLRSGGNQLTVELGEGWWSGSMSYVGENWNYFGDRQSMICRLMITYRDGTKDEIVSSPQTWEYSCRNPRRYASLFQGEVYDARMEGLTEDDYDWHQATEVPAEGNVAETDWNYDTTAFIEQQDLPVRVIDTLTALSVTQVRPQVWVYDMGQNMPGVPEITLRNPREGQQIVMRFAEVLYPALEKYGELQGEIMTENYRAAHNTDTYFAAGRQVETYSPRMTYHGYRYVEITGIDTPLPLSDVRGLVLSSIDTPTSHYECSDELVNRLWNNIKWSSYANFISIPTDCPQRNERMGWSGDISVFSHTATYIADVHEFLRRHCRALRDTQTPEGRYGDVAPMKRAGFGGILWGSAGIELPYQCYRQWADKDIIDENWDAMTRYMRFIEEIEMDPQRDSLIVQHNFGWRDLTDWLGPEDSANDGPLLWECQYIHNLQLLYEMAVATGRKEEAAVFAEKINSRKTFFLRTFVNQEGITIASSYTPADKGRVVDTQTSYILPLMFNVVDGEVREQMLGRLTALIRQNDYKLMTGFVGTALIGECLSRYGRNDLMYAILQNTQYPSWLYPVTQGATTIWERLNSYTHDVGFGAGNSMNSFNHYSFGSVGAWLMERSLGIGSDPASSGFKHFVIQPVPDPTGKMSFARGYYDSEYGRIESSWEITDKGVTYSFTIPEGTTATVVLQGKKVKEYRAGKYVVNVKTKNRH